MFMSAIVITTVFRVGFELAVVGTGYLLLSL